MSGPLNRGQYQKRLITIVDSLMGIVYGCNKKLRIQKQVASIPNILRRDWVHVVDEHPTKNLSPFHAEVAPVIPGDNLIADFFPFGGAIEKLVHVAVKTKSFHAPRCHSVEDTDTSPRRLEM